MVLFGVAVVETVKVMLMSRHCPGRRAVLSVAVIIPAFWFTVNPADVEPKLVNVTPLGKVSVMVAEEILVCPVLQIRIVYVPLHPGCPLVDPHFAIQAEVVGGGGVAFCQQMVVDVWMGPHGFCALPLCPLSVAVFVICALAGNAVSG